MFKQRFMLKWMPSSVVCFLILSTNDKTLSLYCIDDLERACTMEDIEQMTYLDCVIKVSVYLPRTCGGRSISVKIGIVACLSIRPNG